jgi:hypothetical protein
MIPDEDNKSQINSHQSSVDGFLHAILQSVTKKRWD